jgi:hypothetical protein
VLYRPIVGVTTFSQKGVLQRFTSVIMVTAVLACEKNREVFKHFTQLLCLLFLRVTEKQLHKVQILFRLDFT